MGIAIIQDFCAEFDYPNVVCEALQNAYAQTAANAEATSLLQENMQLLWKDQFGEISAVLCALRAGGETALSGSGDSPGYLPQQHAVTEMENAKDLPDLRGSGCRLGNVVSTLFPVTPVWNWTVGI